VKEVWKREKQLLCLHKPRALFNCVKKGCVIVSPMNEYEKELKAKLTTVMSANLLLNHLKAFSSLSLFLTL
jgi:hypothetical protein